MVKDPIKLARSGSILKAIAKLVKGAMHIMLRPGFSLADLMMAFTACSSLMQWVYPLIVLAISVSPRPSLPWTSPRSICFSKIAYLQPL